MATISKDNVTHDQSGEAFPAQPFSSPLRGKNRKARDNVRKLRFFSSIRTKFALTYFAVIAVVLILMNTYFLTESRDMIFASKQTFLQSQALHIAAYLDDTGATLNTEHVWHIMELLDVAGVTHIVVTDDMGNIVYGDAESLDETGFSYNLLQEALLGGEVFFSRLSGGFFSSSAFTPILNAGAIIGVVYVHNEDPEQGAILIDMQSTLQTISIIVVIFSVVMVAFIIWSVMRRITSVLNAIKSVREGEYNYRISLNGNDEIALLGDEFNSLTDRLRETEEIRRTFVANASHELKTPLASIRLLSDSILQNEDIERETVQEFISDIGTEAERLSRTTEKLMTLTRLNSDIPNENRSVNVCSVIISTLRMLRPLAQSKGLKIHSELDEEICVFATEDSLHQVIFNLVENAIKYNKSDGSVTVRLRREADSALLTVDDTGVGVPDEDLPYIFDRFYRVDKARSREEGGSGLGLSIVSDTVRELGGKVSAQPRDVGGMSFQVRFTMCKPGEERYK